MKHLYNPFSLWNKTFILKRKFTLSSLQNYLFQSYSRFSRTKGNSRKRSIIKVQNKLVSEGKKNPQIIRIIKHYACKQKYRLKIKTFMSTASSPLIKRQQNIALYIITQCKGKMEVILIHFHAHICISKIVIKITYKKTTVLYSYTYGVFKYNQFIYFSTTLKNMHNSYFFFHLTGEKTENINLVTCF